MLEEEKEEEETGRRGILFETIRQETLKKSSKNDDSQSNLRLYDIYLISRLYVTASSVSSSLSALRYTHYDTRRLRRERWNFSVAVLIAKRLNQPLIERAPSDARSREARTPEVERNESIVS
jgi:hypothetical protein